MLHLPSLLFLLSCLVLVISGGYLVKLIVRIASYLRLSEFVVAFIIMAFSTSIPELFVGINSAMNKNPVISLGNVIGSNIADLTIIIGIAALVGKGIKVKNQFIKKDSRLMFLISLVPILLIIFDKTLSRMDGIILISIFISYMWYLAKVRKEIKKEVLENNRKQGILSIFLFVICLAVLFSSAHFVVKYATELAIELALPAVVIGLFLVAIGTSLPELIFEIRSVLAKKGDLAIGDAMGSVVCNSTLVLGITAIISPITYTTFIFLSSAIFMVLVALIFMMLMRQKRGLTIITSGMLIVLYTIFVLFEFYVKG